jgi:hypothetical protein
MSPERRGVGEEVADNGDTFHVSIAGVRFLRPDVMRGRSGSVNRGRPRLDLRNGNARASRENVIPVPGEGLSVSIFMTIYSENRHEPCVQSYDTQIPTPTQPIQNPIDAPLGLKGKSVVREFPPVHEVMGGSEQDYYYD